MANQNVEQIELNYWFPYVKRYLKINNLEITESNVRKALNYHNRGLPIQLKNFPKKLIDELVELLNEEN